MMLWNSIRRGMGTLLHMLFLILPKTWQSPSFLTGMKAWFFWWYRILKWSALAIIGVLVYCAFTIPSLKTLERYSPPLSSHVFDQSGRRIAEFGRERRHWVAIEKVPAELVDAVVSIEDRDFWHHGGIDLGALPSALLPALRGERVRGASTLTQQLAKNAFLGSERSLFRKVRELLISIRLEQIYTKNELLELYLNTVYLGAGAHGFADAAWRYFSRPLNQLHTDELACLAGLLSKPESLRLDKHMQEAMLRRNLVLLTMVQNGKLSRASADSFSALPLKVHMQAFSYAKDLAPLVSDRVHEVLDSQLGAGFADSAGARVVSTIDTKIQVLVDSILKFHRDTLQQRLDRATLWSCNMPGILHRSEATLMGNMDQAWAQFDSLFLRGSAEKAARICPESLRRKPVEAALVVLDTKTGGVRAMVGGLTSSRGGYDRAVQAARSPGSSFKAIIYAAAIDHGYSPADMVDDAPIALPDPDHLGKSWRPHNLEYDYDGRETYRRALYRSRNLSAVRVAAKVGFDTLVETAHRFGLKSPMRAIPSLALGGLETNVWEMAAAFRALAVGGKYQEPHLIEKVLDRQGMEIPISINPERRAVSPEAAYILCDMLRDVNIRGTAADIWASGFTHPSAGKTGTSNDNRDAWYVGFTKYYTVAVWLGNDNFASLDGHFTGTDAAMPVWRDLMKIMHRGLPHEDFEKPEGLKQVTICRRSGLAASPSCDSLAVDWQKAGFPKREYCNPLKHATALATMPHAVARPQTELQGLHEPGQLVNPVGL